MVPLEPHESARDLIGLFIRILAEELDLNLKSLRSVTLKRADLDRRPEADNCYYIGKIVDLNFDPPPDWVVEVEMTHSDIDKLDIIRANWDSRILAVQRSTLANLRTPRRRVSRNRNPSHISPYLADPQDAIRFDRTVPKTGRNPVEQSFSAVGAATGSYSIEVKPAQNTGQKRGRAAL